MSELTNIKTGMLKVLIANVVNLIIGLLSSFILPKFLSINSYAEIKTFQLYVSYIGLLHFGYVDALYLLYGGQEINKIDKDSLKENLSTFQVFQVIVTIISIGIGVVFMMRSRLVSTRLYLLSARILRMNLKKLLVIELPVFAVSIM